MYTVFRRKWCFRTLNPVAQAITNHPTSSLKASTPSHITALLKPSSAWTMTVLWRARLFKYHRLRAILISAIMVSCMSLLLRFHYCIRAYWRILCADWHAVLTVDLGIMLSL